MATKSRRALRRNGRATRRRVTSRGGTRPSALAVYAMAAVWKVSPSKDLSQRALDELWRVKKQPFGTFVTVVRSRARSAWPYDVHGCQGMYPTPCNAITLRKAVMDAAWRAVHEDDRRNYFPAALEEDGDARVRVSILHSLERVKKSTARKSSNRTYGATALSPDTGRPLALFLPGVYPTQSVWDVRDNLRSKGHYDTQTVNLARFRTTVFEATVINCQLALG